MSRRYRTFHARLGAASLAGKLATALHPYCEYVPIAHLPTRRTEARWGHGRPPHPGLDAIVASGAPAYERAVQAIASRRVELARIARDGAGAGEPQWANAWIPALDGACLYTFVRDLEPRRYVEVGSGISTLFVDRARRDGHLGTAVTSIDPEPRADVDACCDRVVRAPLESVDPGIFGELERGDVVFVDNSHLVLMGSDVVVFLLEVLPSLVPGVLVGVHDVFLPSDYFPFWGTYYFGEQYMLAALLLGEAASTPRPGGGRWIEPFMASYYVSSHPELSAPLDELWAEPCFSGIDPIGWSFWFLVGDKRPSG